MTDVRANPFSLTPPDEETELSALANALQMRDGFSLLFARCNQPDERRRLMEKLKERLPGFNIQEIFFTEPINLLLDELRLRLLEPPPNAIFVSRLEYSLPVAAEASQDPLVAALNASRNSFSRYLPCPLVLWVPDYILNAIFQGAPDFFSVRSGVYYFPDIASDTVPKTFDFIGGEAQEVVNLPLEDKLERIRTIQGLLEMHQALPEAQKHYPMQIRLLNQLGALYIAIEHWQEAEVVLQHALQLMRHVRYDRDEASTLSRLGWIYQRQREFERALNSYRESLEIFEFLEDREGIGQTLCSIGTLYAKQGQLKEAEETLTKALSLASSMNHLSLQQRILFNLAEVYFQARRELEAKQALEQSVEISRRIRDEVSETHGLYNLSLALLRLNDLKAAEEIAQQGIALLQKQGRRYEEALMLGNLGLAYQRQGRLVEAEKTYERSIAIAQEFGNAALQATILHNMATLILAQGDTVRGAELQSQANYLEQTSG